MFSLLTPKRTRVPEALELQKDRVGGSSWTGLWSVADMNSPGNSSPAKDRAGGSLGKPGDSHPSFWLEEYGASLPPS